VTDMHYMFYEARAFNQKLCWNRSQATTTDIFLGTACPNQDCWGEGTPGACS